MLDRVEVILIGGDGGPGISSFHREKFVLHGGPDGGDGGRGGQVILKAVDDVYTLEQYRAKKLRRAEGGQSGGPSLRTGATGRDLLLPVPAGTIVLDTASQELIADLARTGDEVVIAQGGRGGWGNKRFATSTNQAPTYAQKGGLGEEIRATLDLRLLADVGLLGLPNAGKSTLLAAISNAKPKVAAYPFTTLEPMLGVVEVGFERFTVADLPGLIEGASEGFGLGFEFLKHVRRCRVLLHLVDCTSPDPATDFQLILNEIGAFEEQLSGVRQLVAISKADTDPEGAQEKAETLRDYLEGTPVFIISAESGEGIEALLQEAFKAVEEERRKAEEEAAAEIPILRPPPRERWNVEPAGPNRWEIFGSRIVAFVEMMSFEMSGAQEEVERRMDRWGVTRELRRLGAQPGDMVIFGETEIRWGLPTEH